MDNNTTSAPVEQKKSFDFLVANGINVQSGIDILGDSETYDSMLKEFHNLSRSKYSKIKTKTYIGSACLGCRALFFAVRFFY